MRVLMFPGALLHRPISGIGLLIATLNLSGCDSGDSVHSKSGDNVGAVSPAPSVATTPRFVYRPNAGDDSISIYAVDAATGQLRRKGTVAAGASPGPVTIDPSGRFAYVANNLADTVSAYTINAATGELSQVGMPVATGMTPRGVTVDPSGKFAYVVNFSSNDVSAFAIDYTTGALIPVGVVQAGVNPVSVSIDPAGKAYVTNFNSSEVLAYSINPATGALTPIGTAAVGGTSPFTDTKTGANR